MKKKIVYGSLLAIVFALSLVFKTKHDENLQKALLFFGFDIGIDIEIGSQNCVCKGSSCSEANWISFRENCGSTTGGAGGNTNAACSRFNGRCD